MLMSLCGFSLWVMSVHLLSIHQVVPGETTDFLELFIGRDHDGSIDQVGPAVANPVEGLIVNKVGIFVAMALLPGASEPP